MPRGDDVTEQQAEELDRLTSGMRPAGYRTPAQQAPLTTRPPKPADDRVELKFGPNGFQLPQDPRWAAPPAQSDRRPAERMCMRATRLEIISDGSLAGTQIIIDGVAIGGVRRFELIAQNGYPRVTAVVDLTTVHEQIGEHGDRAGKEVRQGDAPAIVTADVFRRQ